MFRARIWISASRGVEDAFIIEEIGEAAQHYGFTRRAGDLDWLGAAYPGSVSGFPGTFYDLPRGFPTNNTEAALRANDPSISNTMRLLLRSTFPLRHRSSPRLAERRIA